MRRCGGAGVRRCGGTEVRRCGGAEVRRCIPLAGYGEGEAIFVGQVVSKPRVAVGQLLEVVVREQRSRRDATRHMVLGQ